MGSDGRREGGGIPLDSNNSCWPNSLKHSEIERVYNTKCTYREYRYELLHEMIIYCSSIHSSWSTDMRGRERDCVCVCERERECVCERERESVCVRVSVCMCV